LSYKQLQIALPESVDPPMERKLKRTLDNFLFEYAAYSSMTQELPLDCTGAPIPWFTYPAIEYMNQIDFSACRVLEFGSGNSSLYWASRCAHLSSVERDPDWFNKVKEQLSGSSTNITCTQSLESYLAYVETLMPKSFDVVVVDGADRFVTAKAALPMLKDDGLIILDNSDWYPNACELLRESGLIQVDFCGFGPINSYTWCTSFFLSRSFQPTRLHSYIRTKCNRELVKMDDRPA